MYASATLFVPLAALGALAACADVTSPHTGAPITLSFATGSSAGPVASRSGGARLSLDVDGSGALVITRARIVLREIELESPDFVCGFSDDSSRSRDDDDDCEIELAPRIVDLPLDGGTVPLIGVNVPEGIYDEIEFELHKPDDDTPADLAFIAANPDFRRISVRVEGTWNGTPFVYETDQNAELELEFRSPLHVGADGVNITVNVDVASWFRTAGGSVIRPSSANADLIDDRIRQSFRAFEDDDRDGDDDGR